MTSQRYTLSDIKRILEEMSNPETADFLQKYFKTGPGEYGEGDRFRGIKVPVIRKIARKAKELSVDELSSLLDSPWHEDRLLALLVWVDQFNNADKQAQENIYDIYMEKSERINNWDLVDLSAPTIMGGYLWGNDRSILYEMAQSPNLWSRRMAIMSTFYFIRNDDYKDALALAELLLNDSEDLIHKAVGWMLREIGKRNLEVEESFLKKHYKNMPRTMLRYAIERFPEERRQAYLKGTI